jgi:hypothetical protein
MSIINPATRRQLQSLPKTSHVWEGARLELPAAGSWGEGEEERECVVWIDGVEGIVRAMDTIGSIVGHEGVARTLLRAIQSPQPPAQPNLPQKIVVRDRQLQFYLRGALQELGIAIEYANELPLIDRLFERMLSSVKEPTPTLPPQYAKQVTNTIENLWRKAPWQILADCEIFKIEVNRWDIDTLYVCCLGMMGVEYGVLLYRTLDSLEQFRVAAGGDESTAAMESAFLSQDCIFVTFDASDMNDVPLPPFASRSAKSKGKIPEIQLGSIHPLEGMRPFLYEEEALLTFVGIGAFVKFVDMHRRELSQEPLPPIEETLEIVLPPNAPEKKLSVVVSTQPEITERLLDLMDDYDDDDDDDDDDDEEIELSHDWLPDNSFVNLASLSWQAIDNISKSAKYYRISADLPRTTGGLPVLIVQTSRNKVSKLVEAIDRAGGLEGICLVPSFDEFWGTHFFVGILRFISGENQVFGEYREDDTGESILVKKWGELLVASQGNCALIIAQGISGKNAHNPTPSDIIAAISTQAITPDVLGDFADEEDDDSN